MFSAFFRDLRTEFAGYNADKLLKDVMAGLTVCAVALPLALAFGVSSGASAAAGLVTAILAGIVIALLGGASYQVSGPTGAMSAVLIGIVAQYGLQGVFFACFAAGVLLLAAGLLKLGRLIGFIPMPVIMGFTSGIAIIIALGQVDNFFGTVSEGSSSLEKLASYARLGFHPDPQASRPSSSARWSSPSCSSGRRNGAQRSPARSSASLPPPPSPPRSGWTSLPSSATFPARFSSPTACTSAV